MLPTAAGGGVGVYACTIQTRWLRCRGAVDIMHDDQSECRRCTNRIHHQINKVFRDVIHINLTKITLILNEAIYLRVSNFTVGTLSECSTDTIQDTLNAFSLKSHRPQMTNLFFFRFFLYVMFRLQSSAMLAMATTTATTCAV